MPSKEMERLTASVQALDSVVDSAVAALNGVAQQVRDTAGDRQATNALADDLDARAKTLADAIVANTPAASASA